jgi:hypothetical protein
MLAKYLACSCCTVTFLAFTAAVIAESEARTAAQTVPGVAAPCSAADEVETVRTDWFTIDVPRGWLREWSMDAQTGQVFWIARPSLDGASCGVSVVLVQGDAPAGFGYDPLTAADLLLKGAPDGSRTRVQPFPYMIGNLLGTSFSVSESVDGSTLISDVVGGARNNFLFFAKFVATEQGYAAARDISDRVLSSLRIVKREINLNADRQEPVVASTTAGAGGRFLDDMIRFDVPPGWRVQYSGPDPDEAGYRLVTLHSPARDEFAEVRYIRFQVNHDAIQTGPRLTAGLMRRFGSYSRSDESVERESSLAGQASTQRFRNELRGTQREWCATSISASPMFAHVSYTHPEGGAESARKYILDSLHFTVGPTVVGTWQRQGDGITFKQNGAFERFGVLGLATNLSAQPTTETGEYEANGDVVRLRPARSTSGSTCRLASNGSRLDCGGEPYTRHR